MNILTRLFVIEWFKALLGALVALLLLVTTADLINGFLRGKDGAQVFLEWSLKMPDLTGKMLPVTCLLATLFSLNRLKTNNELIAALSAGFSFTKISSIVIFCSLTMVVFQFANLGFAEPFANKIKRQEISKSKASEGKYLTRSVIDGGQFWFKSKNYFSTFLTFDRKTSSLNGVRFYYFDSNGLTTKVISAKRAVHFKDKIWKLEQVKILENLSGSQFPKLIDNKEQDIELNEAPSDFGEFESDLTTLSWFHLKDFINKISNTGINTSEYRILLHQKVALSLACMVFALIPLSGLYRPNRRSDSFGKSVALALILTVVFWLLFSSTLGFGQSGKLPPWLAAYIVPGLFLSQALWTYLRNRKLAF